MGDADIAAADSPPLILIVDDDPIVRSLMRTVLENGGFSVIEAGDGEEACRLYEDNRPELLIVDVVMPGMDGFTLCRELRRRPAWIYVPILMATGLDDLESIAQAYEAGATDFIPKPLNWLIMTQRVRYMLRAGRAVEELNRNQQRLIAAKDAAEMANRTKTEFLANMGHELRTPLNAVIGFATLLRDTAPGDLGEVYVDYSSAVVDSGTHLLAIINDILDLAKAEANMQTLTTEEVDIERVVAVCGMMASDMAQAAGVDYRAEIGEGLPVLHADTGKLRQILINLLSNAVKFTPEGGRVCLRVVRESAETIAFSVEDSGIGIAEDKMPIAMAPFGQIDSGLARKYEGTGLGLPLTKRLIELHGGTMEIVSSPGKGTIVTVRLPAGRRCAPMPSPEQYQAAE